MRPIPLVLVLASLSLCACPPVRDGGTNDDDDATSSDTLLEVWESLEPGQCVVLPAGEVLLSSGAGRATEGLWYDAACIWTGGNASSVTIEVSSFDTFNGGDFAANAVRPVDAGGREVPMEGDLGVLTLMAEGDSWVFNGWWEGDLSGADAAGQAVRLEAVVWKEAVLDSVVGR